MLLIARIEKGKALHGLGGAQGVKKTPKEARAPADMALLRAAESNPVVSVWLVLRSVEGGEHKTRPAVWHNCFVHVIIGCNGYLVKRFGSIRPRENEDEAIELEELARLAQDRGRLHCISSVRKPPPSPPTPSLPLPSKLKPLLRPPPPHPFPSKHPLPTKLKPTPLLTHKQHPQRCSAAVSACSAIAWCCRTEHSASSLP